MPDPSITRADVRARTQAQELARTDPHRALEIARAIRHPWYRCQALAAVADAWGTQAQKRALLEDAFAAADQQSEINRIVTVSAWPIAVLTRIAPDAAATQLQRLIALAEQEPHTLRRADALYAVATAVRGEPRLLAGISPALVTALLTGHGWRIDRLIRRTVELLQRSEPDAVDTLIAHHRDGQRKRALLASVRSADPRTLDRRDEPS